MAQDTKKAAIGERTQTLKAVPFFTQLTDKELDVVRSVATEKHFPKNAVVLTEGEMGDSLYMIQTGQATGLIGEGEGLHGLRGRPRDHPEAPGPVRLLRRDVDDRQAAALGVGHDDRALDVPRA